MAEQNKGSTRSAAALIGLGSAVIGGLLSKHESSSQREWQENMWERNNLYNSPEEQVKRLRQAGFNPALAMSEGAIGSGNSSSPADSYELPQYSAENLMEGIRLDNETKLANSQSAKLDQETEAERIRNVFAMQKERYSLLNMMEQPGISKWTKRRLMREYDYLGKQIEMYDDLTGSVIQMNQSSARVNDAEADLKEIEKMFKPDEWQKTLKLLDDRSAEIKSAINANNTQAALNIAHKALAEAQKYGVDISNEQADAVVESYVDKAYWEADEQYWKSRQARKEAGATYKGVGPYTVRDQKADESANDPNHMRIRYDRKGRKYMYDNKSNQRIYID